MAERARSHLNFVSAPGSCGAGSLLRSAAEKALGMFNVLPPVGSVKGKSQHIVYPERMGVPNCEPIGQPRVKVYLCNNFPTLTRSPGRARRQKA